MARALDQAELMEVVGKALQTLNKRIRIDLAILFGSYSQDEADSWSDIDLAVISPDFERMSLQEQMALITQIWHINGLWVQIHPFTPKDLAEARPTNFLGHLLRVGQIVYRKDVNV